MCAERVENKENSSVLKSAAHASLQKTKTRLSRMCTCRVWNSVVLVPDGWTQCTHFIYAATNIDRRQTPLGICASSLIPSAERSWSTPCACSRCATTKTISAPRLITRNGVTYRDIVAPCTTHTRRHRRYQGRKVGRRAHHTASSCKARLTTDAHALRIGGASLQTSWKIDPCGCVPFSCCYHERRCDHRRGFQRAVLAASSCWRGCCRIERVRSASG